MIITTGNLEHITTLVKEMSLSELQNTVLLLAEKNEHIRGALHQIWKEQQRKALLLKSVEWTPADWLEARIHFEPIIQDELRQCAECFIDLYENGYSNFDSEEGRFDFTEGLDQLNSWFAELLEMATDGDWIDASVGLLLTLQQLDDWATENGDEDLGGDDLQEECVPFWSKAEDLTAIIRHSAAPDPNKSAFFLELMDWIAGLIGEEKDWSSWKEVLSACLFSSEHYQRLKEHVKRLEPNLFSYATEEIVRADVVHWWVQTSLDWGHETEAERAETRLPAFDAETSVCFAHYYERLDRTEEAIARLQSIIQQIQEQIQRKSSEPYGAMRSIYVPSQQANSSFEWLITIYERTKRQSEAEAWRVQWFEMLPSLELFKRCLDAVPSEERERQAQKWIAHVRSQRSNRFEDLLIDMHLHINDPYGAWSVYQNESPKTSDWISESVRRLFEMIKQCDPERLLPVLGQYAEKRIAEKNRTSYQRAAEWFTELKSVYYLLDQKEAWTAYLRRVKENHRRLPALQDEIAKAKL